MNKYDKLTPEAVTSTYKKDPNKINGKRNTEDKQVMETKDVLNRIFNNCKNCSFITPENRKTT